MTNDVLIEFLRGKDRRTGQEGRPGPLLGVSAAVRADLALGNCPPGPGPAPAARWGGAPRQA